MIFSIIRMATPPFAFGREHTGRKPVFETLGAFDACSCRRATMATIRRSGVPLQYHNVGACSKCTFALIENLPSEAAVWLSFTVSVASLKSLPERRTKNWTSKAKRASMLTSLVCVEKHGVNGQERLASMAGLWVVGALRMGRG